MKIDNNKDNLDYYSGESEFSEDIFFQCSQKMISVIVESGIELTNDNLSKLMDIIRTVMPKQS